MYAASGSEHSRHGPGLEHEFAELLAGTSRTNTGRIVVLRGAPGLGKTTLADRLMDRSRRSGARVVSAVAMPQESPLPYWALHQLVHVLWRDPFLRDRDGAEFVDALSAAMSGGPVPMPERLRLSRLALAFFGQVASRSPLLLVIDDAEWMDDLTRDLLCFVLNRAVGDDVALVLVYNRSVPRQLRTSRLTEVVVRPMTPEEARRVLTAEHPQLPPYVADRILEEADGNRLALGEYPHVLTPSQLDGHELLPSILPLPDALLDLYRDTVASVPPAARRQLVLGAASGVVAGVRDSGLSAWVPDADTLDLLLTLDLVSVPAGDGIHLANRLVRNAIYCLTPPAEVRSAHLELAAASSHDPLTRIVHQAAAASEPNEELASELASVAQEVSEQGRPGLALDMLVRAVALSPSSVSRATRLTAAACAALACGQAAVAQKLLERAANLGTAATDPVTDALLRAGIKMRHDGEFTGAAGILTQALAQATTDADINACVDMALRLGVLIDDRAFWSDIARDVQAHERVLTPTNRLLALTTLPREHVRLAHPIAETVHDTHLTLSSHWSPPEIARFGVAALASDCLADYRSLLWEAGERAANNGALVHGLELQLLAAVEAFQSGLWRKSDELAARGYAAAVNSDAGTVANQFRHVQALLAAARGDMRACDALSDSIDAWGTPRRSGHHRTLAIEARLLNRLSQGDSEAAWSCATRLLSEGRLPAWPLYGSRMILDVVEAHVRSGHSADAAAITAHAERMTSRNHPLRLRFLVTAAMALTAKEAHAATLFTQALSMDGVDRWPFEQARVEYLYGQWLRRHFANVEARRHLTRARDLFDILGAEPWSRRVANELRAAGLKTAPSTVHAEVVAVELTPQESEVAALAAAGLSNKDIAARLFISPRTVSGHLYRIFPKLNVVSRAGLRDALAVRDAQLMSEVGHARPNEVI